MPKTATNYDFLAAPTQDGDLGMLGSYRVLGELGRGGMGYVFRAIDTVLERPVALKVMNKKVASTPNSRDRFLQEARAMAAVHHDNVVVIFEVGMHEGTPFMAMEMLRGETLEAINAPKKNRDYEQVIEYARQISRGLAAAHAKGIVHRDIKPANIWVEEGTNRIKILDFGLALATSPDSDASGVGSVCGTPGYLTPEQARSDPLDDRSDLYSLGVVLYEMCTGQLPTSQTAIPQQLVALLTGTPTPLRQLNPAIPQPLADLIHQLLAKEPIDRPANAVALEKQLDVVARECEAKSETAVSLSKLQMSLKEVVSKQSEPKTETFELSAFDDLAVPAASVPALPGSPAIQSTPTKLAGAKTVPPFGAAKPFAPQTGTASGKPGPVGSKAKRSPASDSKPVSPIVWMGAGILVTLLLVLALAWLILPGQTENTVSVLPPSPHFTDPGSPPTPPNDPAPPSPAPAIVAESPPTPEPIAPKTQNETQNRVAPSPSPPTQPTASIAADSTADSTAEVMAEPDAPEPSALEPAESPETIVMDEDQPDEPKPVPTKVINVNTTVGIGADSTVREAYETSLATKPILLVQKRKGDGVEKQHVHLRFDLQAKGVSHAEVQQARLGMILSIPGQEKLRDTTLKLYGYDAKGADAWVEKEERKAILWSNSISREGLGSLPLLAQWSSADPAYTKAQVVFFSSPELAAFIREASGTTVSFVVSGGNAEGSAVRFISKEGDATKAPTLMLSVAAPASEAASR